jgi:hypothetical protein
MRDVSGILLRLLLRGQTNFAKSLFSLNKVYRPELLLADHAAPVPYELPPPPPHRAEGPRGSGASLYILSPRGRRGRAIDQATERFVEETRIGTAP